MATSLSVTFSLSKVQEGVSTNDTVVLWMLGPLQSYAMRHCESVMIPRTSKA